MTEISYLYVVLAGLLSFLSPCVLPIVPGYLCFMAGTSLDKLQLDEDASKTLYEITLTNEVRVPLYKLRTEFFPLRVCASYKSESKKQGSVAVQTERTGFK